MDRVMKGDGVYVAARVMLASVFMGMGAERLLLAAGILDGETEPASVWVLIFSAAEMLAGFAMMAGWQAGWVALAMALFLLADAVASHPFWLHRGGPEQHGQLLHFLKNMSSVGGLLLLGWVESARRTGRKI